MRGRSRDPWGLLGRHRRVAASVALLALAGGGAWLTRSGDTGAGGQAPQQVPGTEATPGSLAGEPDVLRYERTDALVAELERGLADNRTLLDPVTVGVIETNLAILDAALEEARRALAEDPGSTYLNHHLADTMRRKLQLLRDANALAQQ
jgi:hypothetical protein